jgi:hypothetical protein
MLGGDDSLLVRGRVGSSIDLRAIGGDGDDRMIDSGKVGGYLFSILPIRAPETRTYFYDSDGSGTMIPGPGTAIDRSPVPVPTNDVERYEQAVPDRGSDWVYFPWVNVNPDEGFFGGGTATLSQFGFRATPYRDRLTFKIGYATAPARFKGEFNGDFRNIFPPDLLPGSHFNLTFKGSGLEVLNFFGFGNQTAAPDELKDDNFFKVKQERFVLGGRLHVPLFSGAEAMVGLEGRSTHTDLTRPNKVTRSSPYGIGHVTTASIVAGVTIDSRRNTFKSQQGAYLNVQGAIYPQMDQLREPFSRVGADARAALSAMIVTPVTLALHAAGEKIWGAYPYYESAFIGGIGSIRGFDRERFAGDASLLGGAELRLYLGKAKLIVPAYIGILGFGETGRVYVDGETSNIWHPSFGGGLWFTVVDPANTLSIMAARSVEGMGFYVTGGFGC